MTRSETVAGDRLAGTLGSAGERLALRCAPRRVARILTAAVAGELRPPEKDPHSLAIEIEDDDRSFTVAGFSQVARGVWRRGSEVVIGNVCSSGFDLRLTLEGDRARFVFRHRPPVVVRAASMLPARSRQLTLLTLLAYPAMWWAVRNGRAPIHGSAFETSGRTVLVVGASGVGKSTVFQQELSAGSRPLSDNLSVTDGITVWPVAEPMRIEGHRGTRAPHGRIEESIRSRLGEASPSVIVVLRRGTGAVRRLDPAATARALVAGTYMAGELRRFWSFTATLAAATDIGPSHPPVATVAESLARALPGVEVTRETPNDPLVSSLVLGTPVAAGEGVV